MHGCARVSGDAASHGYWEVEDLSTKPPWVQEAIQSCSVEVRKAPRAEHASDFLTHPVGE